MPTVPIPDGCPTCGHGSANVAANGAHMTARCAHCDHYIRHVSKADLGLQPRTVQSRAGIKPSTRARVLDAHGHACITCGRRPPEVILHVDHLIPVELAKRYDLYDDLIESEHNLAPSCEECNLGKSDGLYSARTVALFRRHLEALAAHTTGERK